MECIIQVSCLNLVASLILNMGTLIPVLLVRFRLLSPLLVNWKTSLLGLLPSGLMHITLQWVGRGERYVFCVPSIAETCKLCE